MTTTNTATNTTTKPTVHIGYVPLLDSAPLIIAQEAGFFAQQGIQVDLVRENNWASIRDKLMLGMIDAAHLLAPMVVASHLQQPSDKYDANKAFKTAMALGYNGNAISISKSLCQQLNCQGKSFEHTLELLKQQVDQSSKKLVLGTVHAHSMHTYLLHLLLKKAEIGIDQVEIKVIPPVHMVEAMQEGSVDLFCVGEPWNTAAQIEQAGKILCYGSELWGYAPEKVLAVNNQFANSQIETHKKLIKAIYQACQWLEQPDHMAQAAIWLASNKYLNCSSDLLIQSMINQWHSPQRPNSQRKMFHSENANAPWMAHAQWIQQAMISFGQLPKQKHLDITQTQAYDWQTFNQVLTELNLEVLNKDDAPPVTPL